MSFKLFSVIVSNLKNCLVYRLFLNTQKFQLFCSHHSELSSCRKCSPKFLNYNYFIFIFILDFIGSLFIWLVPKSHYLKAPHNSLPSSFNLLDDPDKSLKTCFQSDIIIENFNFLWDLLNITGKIFFPKLIHNAFQNFIPLSVLIITIFRNRNI